MDKNKKMFEETDANISEEKNFSENETLAARCKADGRGVGKIICTVIAALTVMIMLAFTSGCSGSSENTDTKTDEGLKFKAVNGGYEVVGIGGCTDTDIVIPSTYDKEQVIGIGSHAFYGCTSLTSVVIPDSVITIGSSAFSGCSGLTSVTMGNSVSVIGDDAFSGCTALTSAAVPDSVTAIGERAFLACTALTSATVPDGVVSIGCYAFCGCKNITSVTIPNSVTSIGNGAFSGCDNSVFNEYENAYYIGNDSNPYYALLKVKSSDITSLTLNKDTVVISEKVLPVCDGLTDIVIPDGATGIGDSWFENCSALKSVIISDSVTSIGKNAFKNCSSLISFIIPDGVTNIGISAFEDCSRLASITIGESVTEINYNAFNNCRNLIEVVNRSSLDMNVGWYSHGQVALYATEVHTGESKIVNADDYLFYTYDGVNYLFGYVGDDTDLVLPDSYNGESYEIYKSAFYECDSLTSVVISSGVEVIGNDAFYGCSALRSVTFDDNARLSSIGNSAFYGCTALESAVIPDGVTNIGNNAFCACSALTSVVIPDSVTDIEAYAFYNCTNLKSAVIGNGVKNIENYAFSGCSSLNFNEYDNACYLGNESNPYFVLIEAKSKYITSCTIHSDTVIVGSYAFDSCYNLTSVVIPDSVICIERAAFCNCANITDVYYTATEADWSEISIDAYNSYFTDATVHYGYVCEE